MSWLDQRNLLSIDGFMGTGMWSLGGWALDSRHDMLATLASLSYLEQW